MHLLQGDEGSVPEPEPPDAARFARAPKPDGLAAQVAQLRQELDELRRDVDALRERLS